MRPEFSLGKMRKIYSHHEFQLLYNFEKKNIKKYSTRENV